VFVVCVGVAKMGVAKKTRKFAKVSFGLLVEVGGAWWLLTAVKVKRIIGKNDERRKENKAKAEADSKKNAAAAESSDIIREVYGILLLPRP